MVSKSEDENSDIPTPPRSKATSPSKGKPTSPGSVVRIGPYFLGKELGRGTYATVRLGIHSVTGAEVAIKLIDKKLVKQSPSLLPRIETEVGALNTLNHPNITKLIDFLETPHHYVIVMEYVSGKDFYHFLKKYCVSTKHGLPAEQSFHLFYQLISALSSCHKTGVAHRDIKPENILMDEDHETLKLTDFGMASVMRDHQLMETSCGSPHYAAPEIIRGEKYLGAACDVWSTGVVLFVMSSGRLPFLHQSIPKLLEMICHGSFEIPHHFEDNLRDLIKRMLHPSYRRRITVSQIKEHPWWLRNCAKLNLDPIGIPDRLPIIVPTSMSDEVVDIDTLGTHFCENSEELLAPIAPPLDNEIVENLMHMCDSPINVLIQKLSSDGPNVEKLRYLILLQRKSSPGTWTSGKKLSALFDKSTETLSFSSDSTATPSTSGNGKMTEVVRHKQPNHKSVSELVMDHEQAPALHSPTTPTDTQLAKKMKSFLTNLREKICGKRPPTYQQK